MLEWRRRRPQLQAAFDGAFEIGQSSSHRCDIIALQMQQPLRWKAAFSFVFPQQETDGTMLLPALMVCNNGK